MNSNFGLFLTVLIGIAGVYSQNVQRNYDARYAKTLDYKNEVGERNWYYSFDTDNSIHQDQTGVWTGTGQAGPDGEELGVNNVNGYASYYLDDGTPFSINYNADDLGYRPRFVIGTIVGRDSDSGVAPRPRTTEFVSRAAQFDQPQPRPGQSDQPQPRTGQFGQSQPRQQQFGQPGPFGARPGQFNQGPTQSTPFTS